ncbi:olfactory receptor 10A4-like [Rhineura floridana]|uniref:olfactory receptor 10A4-like n=1 Tax=Rhineura floridana TaxID=261503 RepID=UPI002AC7F34E|nr:olfactory receptor 10A4-like [Rhineura floridana]
MKMDGKNQSLVSQFIFEPLSDVHFVKIILFLLMLALYLMTLMGNIFIIIVTLTSPALHSPMYFFLRNLSYVEICYTSTIIPKMLSNLLSEDMSISFIGCATQMYFFGSLGIAECCLLAAMAYDRYVAVCHPLHYTVIMNKTVCLQISVVCWLIGVLVIFVPITFIFTLPFCGPNRINHFFCDVPPLLSLACADTFQNEIIIFIITVVFIMLPFLLILISYICILHTIMKMSSATSRSKSFSTCSSHITVATLFYGSAVLTYLRPKSDDSMETDKVLSLFYTVVCPMMNPLIYSLRNKEVKDALKKLMEVRKVSSVLSVMKGHSCPRWMEEDWCCSSVEQKGKRRGEAKFEKEKPQITSV